MKKFLLSLLLVLPFTAYPRQEVASDSISSTLDEVVVTADAQIETAKKVILRPTKLEKKHSSNGYSLLEKYESARFQCQRLCKVHFNNSRS